MAADSIPVTTKEEEGKKSSGTVPSKDQRASPVVKQEDVATAATASSMSKRTSPVPPPSSSPTNSVRSHPAPIITNAPPNNRPPSTTSMHSNSSAGPRTTTTSRRGGRTRCRSPPAMIQRPSSTGPPSDPYAPVEDRGAAPPSPANPSAAAAAAAAAAKSITRNPPPPSSWYDSPEGRDNREYRRSRGEGSRYHGGRYYEGGHSRHNWPEEEGGRPPAPPPPRSSRYPPRRGDEHYGYREGYAYPRGGRSSRGEPPYPPYDDNVEYEARGRYPEHRYDERRPRSTSPRPPGYDYRGRDHRHPREDPYYKSKEGEGARAAAGAPTEVKRTTRVIGTATPIHVPRASDPSARGSRGDPSGIFRGRPGSEMLMKPSVQEEESPQNILMALRTPSTSFEEKPPKDGTSKRSGEHPLSPEAPPRIQHSHHASATDSSLFFEPQRSPKSTSGPPQPTSSIDMAPSFTLFNQSFDSIGDTANFFNVAGPLDAALQSTSFGAGLIAGDDKVLDIQLASSAGNFSTQLLSGSGSGALTFGMSPNHSFGNAPPASLRTGNMMVLGGQEHRSASPSQVLDMYGSYSGSGPAASPRSKGGPLDDTHIRMSGTSLGSPSLTRSFGEAAPGQYRSNSNINTTNKGHHGSSDGSPNFYHFLKKHKAAFKECTFLMPGLKAALLEAPDVKQGDVDDTPTRHTRSGDPYGEPNPQDIAIAVRRVASAVCAFGGTFMGDRASHQTKTNSSSNQSIFRQKSGEAATVTPSSSTSTSPGNNHKSRQKAKYDELLPGRYYENDNRLSWEFEEHPPVDEACEEDEEDDRGKGGDGEEGDFKDEDGEGGNNKKMDGDESQDGGESGKKTPTPGSKESDQPKMRYRCKLCGQPKQNHTCPYQQSMARSIGVMIYPAVNAFTSAEPGSLAPALSEMNNFMISGSESVSSAETSPSRPTPDRMRGLSAGIPLGSAQVTPESLRGTTRSATSPVTTPVRSRTPGSSRRSRSGHGMGGRHMGGSPAASFSSSARRKRSHSQMGGGSEDQGDLLFVEAVPLKQEQFRIVTQSKAVNAPDAFTYPSLPLPYAQRKRLSDNLFSLSKEVPQLTDECAGVLREAREKDLWDLAVAQLMTQVVVVVHCHAGDSRFEGLRNYLLTLGISC